MKTLLQTLRVIAVVLMSVTLFSCATTTKQESANDEDVLKNYLEQKRTLEKTNTLSSGFKVRISHSADNEISGTYRIDYKGYLNLPLRVKVQAAGMTTAELSKKLEQAYSGYYKVQNNVNVDIVTREFLIEVRGLVQKPGIYTVKLDTSMEEVMALAGGLTSASGVSSTDQGTSGSKAEFVRIVTPDYMINENNAQSSVRWIRLTDYFLRYNPRNEVLWRGGEQLFFQMSADASAVAAGSQTIQVLGEVHRPGEYPLQSGLDIHWYVGQAGGPTSTADLSNILVIRKSTGDTDSVTFAESGNPLDLSPGDVILVRSTQFKPSMLERIGPFFVSLGSLFVSVLVAFLVL